MLLLVTAEFIVVVAPTTVIDSEGLISGAS